MNRHLDWKGLFLSNSNILQVPQMPTPQNIVTLYPRYSENFQDDRSEIDFQIEGNGRMVCLWVRVRGAEYQHAVGRDPFRNSCRR